MFYRSAGTVGMLSTAFAPTSGISFIIQCCLLQKLPIVITFSVPTGQHFVRLTLYVYQYQVGWLMVVVVKDKSRVSVSRLIARGLSSDVTILVWNESVSGLAMETCLVYAVMSMTVWGMVAPSVLDVYSVPQTSHALLILNESQRRGLQTVAVQIQDTVYVNLARWNALPAIFHDCWRVEVEHLAHAVQRMNVRKVWVIAQISSWLVTSVSIILADELHCRRSDGSIHLGSTSWRPSPCQHCTCVQGLESCSEIRCKRQTSCLNSHVPSGQCCPVCLNETMDTKSSDQPCTTDSDQTFKSGMTWSVSDCTYCSCKNGVTTCRMSQCDYVPCANQEKVPGECCPVCIMRQGRHDCKDDDTGVIRRHNEGWFTNGTCTRCVCINKSTLCSLNPLDCSPVTCDNPIKPEGACCQVCPEPGPQCSYNGKTYQVGDQWLSKNKCRNCTCREHGRKRCDFIACQMPNCSVGSQERVVGQCCSACRGKTLLSTLKKTWN